MNSRERHFGMSASWFRILSALFLLLLLSGCSAIQAVPFDHELAGSKTRGIGLRESAILQVAPAVRREIDRLAPPIQETWTTEQQSVEATVALFKRRLVIDGLKQPWEGLANLETQGLLVCELAEEGGLGLPGLVDILEAAADRTSAFHKVVPYPAKPVREDLLSFMLQSLEQASFHREKAVANLTEEEKEFIFAQAKTNVELFVPQIALMSDQSLSRMKADRRFAELIEERVDYANLIAAAEVLARMSNLQWLQHLATAFTRPLPPEHTPVGITGDLLYVEKSSYGLIIIGGKGPNTYELDNRFALVIDLGGDDLYRGMIASSSDPEHGNAVIIDLAGNDTYHGATFGLATGRLGVGLLIDQSGDDVYQLSMGSGGAGFGGLGILFDAKGNDMYMGGRMTQGAAIGGLGLLFDAAGNDRYTSHGFSVGFGGPQGIGAVIDTEGNDYYQCGNQYPSAYNAQDAPNGKPGDPLFQYDCFGLGTGAGKRVLSKRHDWQGYSLAGGLGLLLDLKGDDQYQGANFSQGHGYFFGAGMLLDLDGNDEYHAARYGHGSSTHYGVSLFNDRRGHDRYGSTGPFYNGGTAWDHSVSLLLDSGNGHDEYAFDQSTGLGRADHSGWGLFIDEGGNDQYRVKSGFGLALDRSLSGFFDLQGKDRYTQLQDSPTAQESSPGNDRVVVYPSGGIFVDR